MAKSLPARPNLDHLKSQAKTLLAQLKDGDASAARTFIKYLPAAKKLSPGKVRAAGLKLADAQSAVARQNGFESWALLSKHVDQLRALEGEWKFVSLEADGQTVPAAMLQDSRLLIDGDRFRMESTEGNYDGIFTIGVSQEPFRIDIEFVEGPEAGNWSYGIYELHGDQLTMCLGLVGSSRPVSFSTRKGSGHALERLRRASAGRQPRATGGQTGVKPGPDQGQTPMTPQITDTTGFEIPMTPLLRRLEGEWSCTKLVRDGEPLRADWLPFGSRTMTGTEMKVVFGGQVMVHARVRIDERASPMAVDYLNVSGSQKGKISLGIMDWVGDEVRFLIAVPGQQRPSSFDAFGRGLTLSQWKRRG